MSEKQKLLDGLCLQRAINIVFNELSSDEEDDDDDKMMEFSLNASVILVQRRTCHLHVPKSDDWLKEVLINFDDGRIRQMIRISMEEFQYILSLISGDPVFQNQNGVPQLPIDLQLQIALFSFGGNGDSSSIRKIATLFGVGDGGTIVKVNRRVIKAVLNLKSRFLYWPSADERRDIVASTVHELPGCVAYIDGTEIRLAEAPAVNHELFFSRKKQYAIKVQIACDYKLKIRQATIGNFGSVHDARMFAESSIGKAPQNFLSHNEFISADSAYPLSQYILTPFRQNSNELSKQVRDKFNEYFSKHRVRVENCIGKLKEKFPSLKELRFRLHSAKNYNDACEWILACCILHNIFMEMNYKEKESEGIFGSEYQRNGLSGPELRAMLANFIASNS